MKKLVLVHEWIGPTGPVSNARIANLADFYHRTTGTELLSQGLDPFYYILFHNNPEVEVILKTPSMLKDDETFVYELEMHFLRDWYSNFFIGKGILENSYVSSRILEDVRRKVGYLMFSTPMESFVNHSMFDYMYRYFEYHCIPLRQVIYATNSPNGKQIYEKYCIDKKLTPLLNCEYVGMYERILVNDTKISVELGNNPYVVGKKSKLFLNFNRRYREQRFWFLLEIYKRNLLNDFYISFDKNEPEGITPFINVARNINDSKGINLSEEQLQDLNNKLPLVLDTPNFSVFPMEKSLDETLHFYNDSLIHIATETNFFTDVIHVSEKTFKPIMYKQPFIFVGPPHILKFLKEIGYKTFSDFWDESYDDIEEHHMRMHTILDLLEKLSKMSDQEKLELSCKAQEIVEYNFELFVNKKPTELYQFIEKYGKE